MTWWQIVLSGLGIIVVVAAAAFIGSVVAALVLAAAFLISDRLQKATAKMVKAMAKRKRGKE